VKAFNADLPYDQFVREQIAGDLIERPRIDAKTGANESVVGTGFWFLGEAFGVKLFLELDGFKFLLPNKISVFSDRLSLRPV
jgi:hypothetical protein